MTATRAHAEHDLRPLALLLALVVAALAVVAAVMVIGGGDDPTSSSSSSGTPTGLNLGSEHRGLAADAATVVG